MNPEEILFIQNTKKMSQIYKAQLFEWEETSLQVLSQIKEFEHNDGNDGIPELTWAVLNVKALTEASQGKTKTNENNKLQIQIKKTSLSKTPTSKLSKKKHV